MPKYIERDSLLKKAKSLQNKLFAVPLILDAIEYAPAADVVEVVRCRECELFVDNKKALVQYCKRECKNLSVKPYDFCSYGKRKEGEENDI